MGGLLETACLLEQWVLDAVAEELGFQHHRAAHNCP